MRRVMRLATMETERENTECFSLFLTIWNNLLAEVSGIPGYKFNPRGIMCDEAGCNFNAIEKVFGQEFLGRTVTCQFHFKSCAKNQIKNINIHEQETFKSLCEKLCYTYMKHDYTKVSNALENLCQRNDIGNWWSWWDVRRFHIVPAFRGFNISGLNLAETGHSTIKTRSIMPLTVAAWRDICLMMLQDRDYEAHMSNTAKVSGKGMNLKQKHARWNKAEEDFVDSCIGAMQNGDLEQEEMYNLHPEKFLVPSKKAKHRVPPTFSNTNPTQTQKCKPTKRKLDEDSNDDSDYDNNELPIVPEVVDQQKLGYNPPHLVMIHDKIIVCSGCEIPFNRKDRQEPTTYFLNT